VIAPAAIGGHVDHVIVRDAARQLGPDVGRACGPHGEAGRAAIRSRFDIQIS
jgi:hypothetical protein